MEEDYEVYLEECGGDYVHLHNVTSSPEYAP